MRTIWERLVRAMQWPVVGPAMYWVLLAWGADISPKIKIGRNLRLPHGIGVVIHNLTTIGDSVTIFSCVTVGRADIYRRHDSLFKGIVLEDEVMLGTGCRVLCKEGILRVGKGTIIGANAVLLQSTGEYEIWAGIPARCIGHRERRGIIEQPDSRSTNQKDEPTYEHRR